MSGISRELQARYGIAPDLLDIYRLDELMAEIREARPNFTDCDTGQEVFLLCYGDEFSPEQREKIPAAIAAYWERKADAEGTLSTERGT